MIDDYGENTPTVMYGPFEDGMYAVFYRVCPKCGRYVKANEHGAAPALTHMFPNAVCKKCGDVEMPFMDWFAEEE